MKGAASLVWIATLAAGCGQRAVEGVVPQAPPCGTSTAAPSMPLVHIGPDVTIEVPCGSQVDVPVASLSEAGSRGFTWTPSLQGDFNIFVANFPTVGISCSGLAMVLRLTVVPPASAVPGDTYDAALTISSPDAAFPTGTVHVHAKVVVASFTIEPSEIDFGDVNTTTSPSIPVTFRSPWAGPVFVGTESRVRAPFTFGTEFLATTAGAGVVNPLSVDWGTIGEHTAEFTWTSARKGGALSPACTVVKTVKVRARGVPMPLDAGAPAGPPDGGAPGG